MKLNFIVKLNFIINSKSHVVSISYTFINDIYLRKNLSAKVGNPLT